MRRAAPASFGSSGPRRFRNTTQGLRRRLLAISLDETKRSRADHPGQLAAGAVVVGISGALRNPAAAVVVGGRLRGFCEQERLTRIRGAGLQHGELPQEAVRAVLDLAGVVPEDVSAYVTAEEGVSIPAGLPRLRLDHHHAHAATAFLTSPFTRAAVLVCDQHSSPEVSVWLGQGGELINQHWQWSGQGFASLFTQCSQVFGFAAGQEHRLEALARLDPGTDAARIAHLFQYADATLRVDPDWKRVLADWLQDKGHRWSVEHGARVAGAFQAALGKGLSDLVSDIRRRLDAPHLCLGGGLFYNTFFNTVVAECGSFHDVFVSPNPGNAGIAAGAALAGGEPSHRENREAISAFLGPEFELEEIKGTLDNCKLSYECLSQGEVVTRSVQDLLAGRLVGWFQGRMEWGHRALGNRSILASPLSPHVLNNLNVFLKQRERHRAYGLSVCEEEMDRHFLGPGRSAWMEYEYRMTDPERFRHVLPPGASTLRVQTVDPTAVRFTELHHAFAAASGTGVLVNTSFNGFSEPIVCSPRDAIRVFYGTGLDVLVLGRFVIRK
jgi:carbamoyltransferase